MENLEVDWMNILSLGVKVKNPNPLALTEASC